MPLWLAYALYLWREHIALINQTSWVECVILDADKLLLKRRDGQESIVKKPIAYRQLAWIITLTSKETKKLVIFHDGVLADGYRALSAWLHAQQ